MHELNEQKDEFIESNELLDIDGESSKMDRLHYEASNCWSKWIDRIS